MKSIYFIGAGGIGMSNLVRYYLSQGYTVGGYDKTPTPLTDQLIQEGAELCFDESEFLIPQWANPEETLIVRTPAVPTSHRGLIYFREKGFKILKRAELLGEITRSSRSLCFAGTHGKTTTSSIAAHILHNSHVGCNAFLGGILKPYNSNLFLSEKSDLTVIEADEYDRSFHHLSPWMAVITSVDPDHLDIYGDEQSYLDSFSHFTSLILPGGVLLYKKGIALTSNTDPSVRVLSYSATEEADYYAENICYTDGKLFFDYVTPQFRCNAIELGLPIEINIENSVASMTIALLCGATEQELRSGANSFQGARRRFDVFYRSEKWVLIDDYGHHPAEVNASIQSIKRLYPDRRLTVAFQPHLFSRTNDFYGEFAQALSGADEVILLDIYPAREEPIEGVTSKLIFDKISLFNKRMCSLDQLVETLIPAQIEVLLTLGAGNIDTKLTAIAQLFTD